MNSTRRGFLFLLGSAAAASQVAATPAVMKMREGELIYRTDGAWGAGAGRPLTAAEMDQNFWVIEQRLRLLEDR